MAGTIGNKNALKYKSKKKLQEGINNYFEKCDKDNRPYSMSGLAYHLGIDRVTLINYGKTESYFTLIKDAKDRVQAQIEENALCGKGNATFSIFNLKNNYGWKDETSVNVEKETPSVEIKVVDNSNLESVLYEENEKN